MEWFITSSHRLLQEEMEISSVPEEPYFVDFLQDAPEPSGDEPEDCDDLEAPKIYEQVYYT